MTKDHKDEENDAQPGEIGRRDFVALSVAGIAASASWAAAAAGLEVVETEFTNVGVNPRLDQFKDLARQLRQEAEEQARRRGRELGAAAARVPAA